MVFMLLLFYEYCIKIESKKTPVRTHYEYK